MLKHGKTTFHHGFHTLAAIFGFILSSALLVLIDLVKAEVFLVEGRLIIEIVQHSCHVGETGIGIKEEWLVLIVMLDEDLVSSGRNDVRSHDLKYVAGKKRENIAKR